MTKRKSTPHERILAGLARKSKDQLLAIAEQHRQIYGAAMELLHPKIELSPRKGARVTDTFVSVKRVENGFHLEFGAEMRREFGHRFVARTPDELADLVRAWASDELCGDPRNNPAAGECSTSSGVRAVAQVLEAERVARAC